MDCLERCAFTIPRSNPPTSPDQNPPGQNPNMAPVSLVKPVSLMAPVSLVAPVSLGLELGLGGILTGGFQYVSEPCPHVGVPLMPLRPCDPLPNREMPLSLINEIFPPKNAFCQN